MGSQRLFFLFYLFFIFYFLLFSAIDLFFRFQEISRKRKTVLLRLSQLFYHLKTFHTTSPKQKVQFLSLPLPLPLPLSFLPFPLSLPHPSPPYSLSLIFSSFSPDSLSFQIPPSPSLPPPAKISEPFKSKLSLLLLLLLLLLPSLLSFFVMFLNLLLFSARRWGEGCGWGGGGG